MAIIRKLERSALEREYKAHLKNINRLIKDLYTHREAAELTKKELLSTRFLGLDILRKAELIAERLTELTDDFIFLVSSENSNDWRVITQFEELKRRPKRHFKERLIPMDVRTKKHLKKSNNKNIKKDALIFAELIADYLNTRPLNEQAAFCKLSTIDLAQYIEEKVGIDSVSTRPRLNELGLKGDIYELMLLASTELEQKQNNDVPYYSLHPLRSSQEGQEMLKIINTDSIARFEAKAYSRPYYSSNFKQEIDLIKKRLKEITV